jgi:hypothetical protein
MRKTYGLVLCSALTLAGCLQLPGNVARNNTVKGELPPQIDPELPPETAAKKPAANSNPQRRPGTRDDVLETGPRSPTGMRGHEPWDDSSFKAALPGQPMTADQVTPQNARAVAEALRRELDQEQATEEVQGLEEFHHGAQKKSR